MCHWQVRSNLYTGKSIMHTFLFPLYSIEIASCFAMTWWVSRTLTQLCQRSGAFVFLIEVCGLFIPRITSNHAIMEIPKSYKSRFRQQKSG
jgi:hypothetical protein